MKHAQEEDIASHGLEVISVTSTWLLVRHQWLIDNMRCLLTGESTPPLNELEDFNALIPERIQLPQHLTERFAEVKSLLEKSWLDATKSVHPMSGLTIFEQLNNFQQSAHDFMKVSKEANQQLLHELAMRDPLTGARTRLTLNICLLKELKKTRRYKEHCCIALIDHNDFKAINDRWGHVTGDQVLINTAAVIQQNLRGDDMLFRYGGDEWLIVMPETAVDAATMVLDRVQKVCHANEFKSPNNDSFFTTFTYGVAESNDHDRSTPQDWISAADKALYKKKEATASTNQNLELNQSKVFVG